MPAAFALHVLRQRTQQYVASQRQRHSKLVFPPLAHIQNAVKTNFVVRQLRFVNDESGIGRAVLHALQNLVEWNDHGFEIGLEYFQGEVGGRQRARNSDFLALHIVGL